MPSIKHSNYTINPCGCVEGNDISTSCLLRRSTFCFSATVKALHVLEVSSAVSRIDSSRRNGSAGDTPHGMRVLRGSETPKLHAAKAAKEGFFTCSKGSMRPATSAQLRLIPVDGILLAAKQRFSGRNLRDRPRERPIFQGFCVSPRRLRSWHHCQQLRNLLRVAGGAGSDAAAEAVDGRAKAMQLDVVGFGESRMWDGCVEIVLGFDTKDGWFWLAVAWRLVVSASG